MAGPLTAPPRGRLLSALLLTAAGAIGCEESKDPVDIPFDGLEPTAAEGPPTAVPTPPSAEASTRAVGPRTVDPNAGAAAAVRACCASLSAAASTAKDEGTKAMNKQAATVCSRKVKPVSEGKLTRTKALAEVRSSLLGPAPAACR